MCLCAAVLSLSLSVATSLPTGAASTGNVDADAATLRVAALAEGAKEEKVRLDAEYELAQRLFTRGLLSSAFRQFAYVVKAGPGHPHYSEAVEGIVAVAEALDEDFITGAVLDKEDAASLARLPPAVLAKVHYLLAGVRYRKNKRDDAVQLLERIEPTSPSYAKARYLRGVLAAVNGEPPKARACFDEVLELGGSPKPSYVGLAAAQDLALLGTARLDFADGRHAEAAKAYDSLPRSSDLWVEAQTERAWAHYEAGDASGALDVLRVLHAPPLDSTFQPESWALQAIILYSLCRYDEASSALDEFDRTYPPIAKALAPLAAGKTDLGPLDRLLAPEDPSLPARIKGFLKGNRRLLRFKAYGEALSKEREAIRSAKAWSGTQFQQGLLKATDDSRELAASLVTQFTQRRLDEASRTITGFDLMNGATRIDSSADVLLGRRCASAKVQPAEVVSRAGAILERNPSAWLLSGLARDLAGDSEGASKAYREAIRINPSFPMPHEQLGMLLLQAGKLEEALAELQPRDPASRPSQEYGYALLIGRRCDQALAALTEAHQRDPKSASTLTFLADALGCVGKPKEAIARYEQAVALEPDSVRALFHLGLARMAADERGAARGPLERALALDPKNASIEKALSRLP
ncbi:MAG: tetratricopeptide repeat protein [Myxococcales bacterium]